MPRRSHEKFLSCSERFRLLMQRIRDTECRPSTTEATMDNHITDFMLDLEVIKPKELNNNHTKELLAIQLEMEYDPTGNSRFLKHQVSRFVDYLGKIQVDSNEEAVTSVQNLKAYCDLSKHLAKVCESKRALFHSNIRQDWPLVEEIWNRARVVANHTAMFFYSCLFEQDSDLNLNLTRLLLMTDPTHPVASAFYFKIFNSMGFSHQFPFPDTDEMNFIDQLLLVLKNQIIQCQKCEAIFVCEKLMACETLVKAFVSYSPLSTKIILYGSIMKHATTILSFSFPIDSGEKNLYESFDSFLEDLVMSGFIGHLLHYDDKSVKDQKDMKATVSQRSRSVVGLSSYFRGAHSFLHYGNQSLKGQLEEFSDYMTHLKVIVSYPPLRYMLSKIILHKVIVKLVIIASSLSSIDTEEVEEDTGNKKNLVLPAEFDVAYEKFMVDVKDIHNLQRQYLEDITTGEQKIGQYIDYLEKVQKQYLSSNIQAIISIQNLRSFQHLSKNIVNWYNNKYMWNNLMSQIPIAMEHTTMFLCSCWIEPEKNQEFKTLEQSVSSPWQNVLAEASFIDHMLFYLKELIQCQTRSVVASLKEQLENLHRCLTVLRNTVTVKGIVPCSRPQYIIPSRMEAFHSLMIEFVRTMETISVTDLNDVKKETLALHDLEENVTLMKTELRKSFIFPFIGFEFFSKNLEEMLTFRSDVIAPMKHQFDMVYSGLLKLRSFLDMIKNKPIENKEEVKDLQQRIIQVSHRADFIIQSYVNRVVWDGPTYYYALQLLVVMEDIQLLITETEGPDTDTSSYVIEEDSYKQASSERSIPNITDIVVGFEDESKDILKHLTGGSKGRNIVAIVGMPGIGKTTIAKKVYNHPSVANRFDCRAWCCVSQSYQKKELLLQILRSIAEVNDDRILEKTDVEIVAMLSKGLKKRRYLIVLDDVWETKVWDDLNRSFPDDNNQSRVIITSRNHDHCKTLIKATPYNYLHPLQLFKYEESFELLQKKLFPQDGFPTELSGAGTMIAKNCKGLPLAVVLAAGILSRMEKNEAHWIKFAESLSKQIVKEADNQCKALIELSYTHLPDHLKCCFLYFGAFPEDKQISVRKLTWLWIAEGFVRDDNQASLEDNAGGFIRDDNQARLEDIAERYMMDLIGRSLVIGSKSVSRPSFKSCHVHDLLRDFCLAKAEEENFLQVVHGYSKHLPPDTSHFDPENPQDPSKFTHRQYRLSIYSKKKNFVMAKPSGPNVRTLLFHALEDYDYQFFGPEYDCSFISRYFKLINVLNLGRINIGDSLTEVALMIHLKYLAVKGGIESIPESIQNLRKLETFIVDSYNLGIFVPNSIWRLHKLRHLHIEHSASINLDSEGIENSALLSDMESFSTLRISYGDDAEKLLRRLPNLRKLKCKFPEPWGDSEKCYRCPVLEFLTQLVSLNVSADQLFPSRYPCRFSFPSNLKKLTLSEFGIPWSEISAIGKLPNLNSLKLLENAFKGKRWDMREGEFLSLQILQLEWLDIEEWSATDEHIPCLQRLMLNSCKELKEIPSEIGNINTLEIIDLRNCTYSAATSARSIQETAEEYGNYTLKVHISS